VSNVEWAVDNPAVIWLGEDGRTLTALSPGTATATVVTDAVHVPAGSRRQPPGAYCLLGASFAFRSPAAY
jgi:hypothetical protein